MAKKLLTAEELQAALDGANDTIAVLTKNCDDLKMQLETLQTEHSGCDDTIKNYANQLSALQAAHASCDSKIADLEYDNRSLRSYAEQANDKITELNGVIASAGSAKTQSTPAASFEHEGKRCEWLRDSFQISGDRKYTAAEAQELPEVLNRLIAIKGQKVLKVTDLV